MSAGTSAGTKIVPVISGIYAILFRCSNAFSILIKYIKKRVKT
jgi:hypothetical protein